MTIDQNHNGIINKTRDGRPFAVPRIHTNGTSALALTRAYEAAAEAVEAAYTLLRPTAPNARDYDSIEDFNEACGQHRSRQQKLDDVKSELDTLTIHADAGRTD
jgi:hypothetical protein